jgi:hypothetical protein
MHLAAAAERRPQVMCNVGWKELNDIEIEASLWYWKKHEKG